MGKRCSLFDLPKQPLCSECAFWVTAVSASEDEAAESGVSGEDGVHAAGRPRLLLRRSGSDAAFLFRGNNQYKCLIHIFTPHCVFK